MTTKNGIESNVRKRVLLVDDEARVRASLKAVLEPTYEVIQAADAQEGLDLFHKEAPHLLLLDVILPGITFVRGCVGQQSRPHLTGMRISHMTIVQSN